MPNLTTSADIDALMAAANKAAAATTLGLGTGDSPQFTAVNVGHATDTTLARSGAGKVAVEGKAVPLAATANDIVFTGNAADRTYTLPNADATLLYAGGDAGTPSALVGTNITGTAAGLTAGVASAVAASGITAGILAANITLGESTGQLVLDPALSADGKWSGIMEAGTAGAALAFGDLVYLAAADSRWELADASAASTSGLVKLGMCVLAAAADGDPTNILLWGKIRADAAFPTFTVSAPVYVSETAGDVTGTQPTTTDAVIRTIGFSDTADSFLFNPSPDFVTHT